MFVRACLRVNGLIFQGRPDATDALTINPGADVSDPRKKQTGAAAPTPSSARYPPGHGAPSDLVPGPSASHQGMDMDNNYAQVNQSGCGFCCRT